MYDTNNSNLPPPHLLEALRFWGGPAPAQVIKEYADGRTLLQYADGDIVRCLPDGRVVPSLFKIGPGGRILSRGNSNGRGDLHDEWEKLERAAESRR